MRVLYVTEGDRDEPIQALIRSIARDKAGLPYPVHSCEVEAFYTRPIRGFGRVQEVLKQIVSFKRAKLQRGEITSDLLDYDIFVAVIDNRAKNKQQCQKYAHELNAVLGIAIEEFEAWILGDLSSIQTWLHIDDQHLQTCGLQRRYRPEKDKNPKATLDCLSFESEFGANWNSRIASQFAMDWQPQLDIIEAQCPKGFKPFARQLCEQMQRKANSLPF